MAAVAEIGIGTGGGDHSSRRRESDHRRQDVRELVEMLSKLNPSAKEFVPSSFSTTSGDQKPHASLSADAPVFDFQSGKDSSSDGSSSTNQNPRRKRNGLSQGRRRPMERLTKAEKEDHIRRTVYVSDIDQSVTEEALACLFEGSGRVVDCRVCGDPNSLLRFAFVEFSDEYGAKAALSLNGFLLGFHPLRILPSKTAIQPVNNMFKPKTDAEYEMCERTIYCTNIDKKVTQKDVKDFFEVVCGEVIRLRLLGDNVHTTRIAFVEFSKKEAANAAMNCSGAVLGSLPIRVSPSKTPVRPRVPRVTSP